MTIYYIFIFFKQGMSRLPLQPSAYPCTAKSDTSIPSSTSSSQSLYLEDPQLYPSGSRSRGSVRGPKEKNTMERSGRSIGGATMNPWEYQQLLESLEDLDGASRGALSWAAVWWSHWVLSEPYTKEGKEWTWIILWCQSRWKAALALGELRGHR